MYKIPAIRGLKLINPLTNENIVLIVTGDRYPEGDAGAVRVQAFADALMSMGLTPFVIGMGESTNFNIRSYKAVKYMSLRYSNNNVLFRLLGRALFCAKIKMVANEIGLSKLSGIIYISGGIPVMRYLKRISAKLHIPFIYDCVEWYSQSEFNLGKFDIRYRENNRINSVLTDNSVRVIAISSYLEQYFSHKEISVVRIPVIMDVLNIPFDTGISNDKRINIVYAGMPGRKDRLSELIRAIGTLSEQEKLRICLHVIGISKQQYEAVYGQIGWDEENSIVFEGRISHTQVIDKLVAADFAFLLRPSEERYAKAGFPTKVVESLSTGTPMLCNLSSDLSMYLTEQYNSVIIDNCTEEACLAALRKVLAMSHNQIEGLKKNARETAENNFDWRKNVPEIKKLIKT